MESTTYRQILAEGERIGEARGEARARQETIALVLRGRLASRAEPLCARLGGCTEPVLARVALALGRQVDDDALIRELTALLDAPPT